MKEAKAKICSASNVPQYINVKLSSVTALQSMLKKIGTYG